MNQKSNRFSVVHYHPFLSSFSVNPVMISHCFHFWRLRSALQLLQTVEYHHIDWRVNSVWKQQVRYQKPPSSSWKCPTIWNTSVQNRLLASLDLLYTNDFYKETSWTWPSLVRYACWIDAVPIWICKLHKSKKKCDAEPRHSISPSID